jgi:hypothetical protein
MESPAHRRGRLRPAAISERHIACPGAFARIANVTALFVQSDTQSLPKFARLIHGRRRVAGLNQAATKNATVK